MLEDKFVSAHQCIEWLKNQEQTIECIRTVDMLETIIEHYDRAGNKRQKGFFVLVAMSEEKFNKYMKLR